MTDCLKTTLFLISFALFFILQSCGNSSPAKEAIATDSLSIATGKHLFEQTCSGCHSLKQNGIGPKLAGLTEEVSVSWIKSFIKNPQHLIDEKDERATRLLQEYKTLMPPFSALEDEDLNVLIAYLHSEKPEALPTHVKPGLADPIPEKIEYDGLELSLQEFIEFPPSAEKGQTPIARITKLDYQPGSGTLFVNDLNGSLYKIKDGKPVTYLAIKEQYPAFINKPGHATGFGSFVFHPDFQENRLFYTTHTEKGRSKPATFSYHDSINATVQWVLTEWTADNVNADIFKGKKREVLRIDMVTGIHGVQDINFNPYAKKGSPDYGMLYVGVGDGGGIEQGYMFLVHEAQHVWGSIIRIDPSKRDSKNGQYGIPKDNPFANTGKCEEVFAFGFRNPHRITWTTNEAMLACNIGQHNLEAIYHIEPGKNYGWPTREGSFVIDFNGDRKQVYPIPENDAVNKITYPVAEYDHDEGLAISGGYEYTGNAIEILKGLFLFGDIPSGRLFYTETASLKNGSKAKIREWRVKINNQSMPLTQIVGNNRVDLRLGRDIEGEMYVLSKANGKVYKIAKP